MSSADTGFELRELLFLFHPLIIGAFALVAIAAVLLVYRRGPQSMALFLALACPFLVGLDFLAFGSPLDHISVGSYVLTRPTAVFVPLLMIGLVAAFASRLRASVGVAMVTTLFLTLSLASPIYILWVLTVGCALTGDCL